MQVKPEEKTTIKVKFSDKIPLRLEYVLHHRYKFKFYSRKKDDWVVFERPAKFAMGSHYDLDEATQTSLIKRCNNIVNQFQQPELYKKALKVRLTNMARVLPYKERNFVLDWISNNVEKDD